MKKIISLFIVFLTLSCSKEESNNTNDQLYEIFKNSSSDARLVLKGSSGTFKYRAFGEFKTSNCGFQIPKNVKLIEQESNNSSTFFIFLDNNYLPIKVYEKGNLDYVTHIFYSVEGIIINKDIRQSDGSYTTQQTIVLDGISVWGQDNALIDNNTPFLLGTAISPCASDIYSAVIENFINYPYNSDSGQNYRIGESLKWLRDIFNDSICNNANGTSFNCDEYSVAAPNVLGGGNPQTPDDLPIPEILDNSEVDCDGVLNGTSYIDSCGNCVDRDSVPTPCFNYITALGTWQMTTTDSCESSNGDIFADNFTSTITFNVDGTVTVDDDSNGIYLVNQYTFIGTQINVNISYRDYFGYVCDGVDYQTVTDSFILNYDFFTNTFQGTGASGANQVQDAGCDVFGRTCTSSIILRR